MERMLILTEGSGEQLGVDGGVAVLGRAAVAP